jgi:RNA polymerase sigma factor (sigma-70 family)
VIASGAGENLAVRALSVESLVSAAGGGDEDAWAALVARYTPLVWGVVRSFQLDRADAADINQTVWLRLVENLHRLREPAALPMWIAKTTRHECLRTLRRDRNAWAVDPLEAVDTYWAGSEPASATAPDEELLRAERRQALRDAFAQLPQRCQRLLAWLLHEPPLSYEEVSARTGMPIGSLGPTRSRCLDRLRRSPALTAVVGSARRPTVAGSAGGPTVVGSAGGPQSGKDESP